MSVNAQFSMPADTFVLGQVLDRFPDLAIELEPLVPTAQGTIPYFWVLGNPDDRFDAELDREPAVASYTLLDDLEGKRLYHADWNPTRDVFLETIIDHNGVLKEAGGDHAEWEFTLRFPTTEQLSSFHTTCEAIGMELTAEGIFKPTDPDSESTSGLTEPQRELLEVAYEEGYFEVPRRITLVQLGERLGISDQAVSERLRRGLNGLVGSTLEKRLVTA